MSFSQSVENLRCIYIYYIERFSDITSLNFETRFSCIGNWKVCESGSTPTLSKKHLLLPLAKGLIPFCRQMASSKFSFLFVSGTS